MSVQAVTQVLERAVSDRSFREQLKTNFDAAIEGYELTAEETAALRKGDQAGLRAIGMDERLSKGPFWR